MSGPAANAPATSAEILSFCNQRFQIMLRPLRRPCRHRTRGRPFLFRERGTTGLTPTFPESNRQGGNHMHINETSSTNSPTSRRKRSKPQSLRMSSFPWRRNPDMNSLRSSSARCQAENTFVLPCIKNARIRKFPILDGKTVMPLSHHCSVMVVASRV